MQYRIMPGTNEKVSILGFGAMRLPLTDEKDPKAIDEPLSISMIRSAIDGGVNYVDTAWPYHGERSEGVVGRALKDGYRDKVFLADKLPTWKVEKAEDFDRFLDVQLERLATDRIDFYLVHALKRDWWEKMKNLDVGAFLERAKADGRIKHAGFSHHDDRNNFKDIVDGYDWSFCQIMYNYLDEHFQAGREGLEYAHGKGLGVVVMEPLRGGKLAGQMPPAIQAIWDEADVKRTPVDWALRWVWDHPEVSLVLSGMSAPVHVEENLAIAATALPGAISESEHALIRRVKEAYKERLFVPCTTCGYCMPCPHGVNIPGVFGFVNNAHLFDHVEKSKETYPRLIAEGSRASDCTECGECEEKCPQGIPIRETLKDVAGLYEPDDPALKTENP